MACGGCARAREQRNLEFVWTDGETEMVYDTEIKAKAKVMRKGGSYKSRKKTT